MLQFMRKHAKFFYIFFVLIIISFIFFYVGPIDKSITAPVAEIGREKITVEEYWRAYERVQRMYAEVYKEKFDEEMEKKLRLKENVLNSLIEERVLLLSAKDLGIKVSDEELEEAIKNEPAFIRDGVFDNEIYHRVLELNRISSELFEHAKRQELTLIKIKHLISESVDLTDYEIKQLPKDDKIAKALRDAILQKKREKAVISYIEGLKKQMKIKINTQLIS